MEHDDRKAPKNRRGHLAPPLLILLPLLGGCSVLASVEGGTGSDAASTTSRDLSATPPDLGVEPSARDMAVAGRDGGRPDGRVDGAGVGGSDGGEEDGWIRFPDDDGGIWIHSDDAGDRP